MLALIPKARQIFQKAAWAPIAVVLFHAVVAKIGIREYLDGVLHFSGGLAIAYFFYRSIIILSEEIGSLRKLGIYLLAYSLACATAVFWELAEFASDIFRHTHVQQSLRETMMDLFWSVTGAAVTMLLVYVTTQRQGNPVEGTGKVLHGLRTKTEADSRRPCPLPTLHLGSC